MKISTYIKHYDSHTYLHGLCVNNKRPFLLSSFMSHDNTVDLLFLNVSTWKIGKPETENSAHIEAVLNVGGVQRLTPPTLTTVCGLQSGASLLVRFGKQWKVFFHHHTDTPHTETHSALNSEFQGTAKGWVKSGLRDSRLFNWVCVL